MGKKNKISQGIYKTLTSYPYGSNSSRHRWNHNLARGYGFKSKPNASICEYVTHNDKSANVKWSVAAHVLPFKIVSNHNSASANLAFFDWSNGAPTLIVGNCNNDI